MVQDNYKPWLVDVKDFPKASSISEKLKFLINFALLAPSTHNSQPWRFKVEGASIFIEPDFNKRLAIGDTGNQFLFISLGCALENLLIAGQYYGFVATVTYPSANNRNIEVVFNQEKNDSLDRNVVKSSLIFFISKRVTNRHKFSERLPEDSFLSLIRCLKTEALQVDIFTVGEKFNQIKFLINSFTPALLNQPDFRKELSAYVKTNLTRSKVGMPAFVMGVPTLPSLLVPTLLKYINLEKFNKKKKEGASNAKIFISLSTKNNTEEDWVMSGQAFQRINLLATESGLSTQPMMAPLHNPQGYEEFKKILQTNFFPQFLFRLGYALSPSRHSPRMSVDDCLISAD